MAIWQRPDGEEVWYTVEGDNGPGREEPVVWRLESSVQGWEVQVMGSRQSVDHAEDGWSYREVKGPHRETGDHLGVNLTKLLPWRW